MYCRHVFANLGDFLFFTSMKTITPKKLSPGDEIRIIAPSSSLSTIPSPSRRLAQKRLEELGFTVTFGKNAMKKNVLGSSSIIERLADWNEAWSDPNVKAILCATGGYNTNQLLSYIDWNIVKQNPKIFCGYSDITVLLNALYKKTRLVTYHGPNFGTLAMQERVYPYTEQCFTRSLMREMQPTVLKPSSYWCENATRLKKNLGAWIIQSGIAFGTVVGGNLCSLNLLQGTVHMPTLKDSILCIEDDPLLCDFDVEFERNLQSVLQQKGGGTIRGIVIGRFQTNCNMTKRKLIEITRTKKELKNIPIIANVDFGHTQPQWYMPIGGRAYITATKTQCDIRFE